MTIPSSHEEQKRSVLKAVSWRMITTSVTMFLVYAFTGVLELSATIGIFDVVLKMALFFFHERMWNIINFGRSIGGTMTPVHEKIVSRHDSDGKSCFESG